MMIQELKLIKHIEYSRRSLAQSIKFGSSVLEEEDLQEDLSIEFVSLDLL